MKIVAQVWRELPSKEKRMYEDFAEQDKVRAENEKQIWVQHLRRNPYAAIEKKKH